MKNNLVNAKNKLNEIHFKFSGLLKQNFIIKRFIISTKARILWHEKCGTYGIYMWPSCEIALPHKKSLKICQFSNAGSPREHSLTLSVTTIQNFNFSLRRDHQRQFLYKCRTYVSVDDKSLS